MSGASTVLAQITKCRLNVRERQSEGGKRTGGGMVEEEQKGKGHNDKTYLKVKPTLTPGGKMGAEQHFFPRITPSTLMGEGFNGGQLEPGCSMQ